MLPDDPLTMCFLEYYRYYAGYSPKPASDLRFNALTIAATVQAKAMSGIPLMEEADI